MRDRVRAGHCLGCRYRRPGRGWGCRGLWSCDPGHGRAGHWSQLPLVLQRVAALGSHTGSQATVLCERICHSRHNTGRRMPWDDPGSPPSPDHKSMEDYPGKTWQASVLRPSLSASQSGLLQCGAQLCPPGVPVAPTVSQLVTDMGGTVLRIFKGLLGNSGCL